MSATELDREAIATEVGPGAEHGHARYLWVLIVITGFGLWVVPATTSYWLDETVTVWVTSTDFAAMIQRAFEYQQSPLYFVAPWLVRQLGGDSELLLRIPSLVFAAAAAAVLFGMVRSLAGSEPARLAVLAFVASPWVAFAASDARPYALGILFVVVAYASMLAWIANARPRDGALFTIAVVAAAWTHYLLALVVAISVVYVVWQVVSGRTQVPVRHLVLAAFGMAAFMAPLAIYAPQAAGRVDLLTIPGATTLSALAAYVFPPLIVLALVVGGVVARAIGPVRKESVVLRPGTVGVLAGWVLVQPALLLALASAGVLGFLPPRYFIGVAPAVAASCGILLAWLGPSSARRIVAAVFAIVMVLALAGRAKGTDDWRDAMAAVAGRSDGSTTVLVRPGLIESAQPDWLTDPSRRGYLLAPTSAYPPGGSVVLLPYDLSSGGEYMDTLIGQLADEQRFLYVGGDGATPIATWLDGRLRPMGFRVEQIGAFGGVYVLEFTKAPTP